MRFLIGILLSVFIGLPSVLGSQKVICNTLSLKTTGVVIETTSNKKVETGSTTNNTHKLISLKYDDGDFQATEHVNSLSQNSFRANPHSIQRWKRIIAKVLLKTDEQRTSVSRHKTRDSFYQVRTKRAPIYVYVIMHLLI